MKRFLCFLLVICLCFSSYSSFNVNAGMESSTEDIKCENSMVIKVKSGENKTFSSEDFPEIGCKKIYTIEKSITTNEYEYTLFIVLDGSGIDYVNNEMGKAGKLPNVIFVDDSTKYIKGNCSLSLDKS